MSGGSGRGGGKIKTGPLKSTGWIRCRPGAGRSVEFRGLRGEGMQRRRMRVMMILIFRLWSDPVQLHPTLILRHAAQQLAHPLHPLPFQLMPLAPVK